MDELCGFSDHHHYYSSSASSSSMAMPQQQQEQQFPLPAAEYYSFEPLSAVVPGSDPAVYYYTGSNSSTDCVSVAAVAVARGGNQPSGGAGAGGGEALCSAVNAKIASHPLYPNLVQAYIDCQKVGAPPQIADILEEIRRESDELSKRSVVGGSTYCMGVDPELDDFMETYCQILIKYKSDLTKPFDEAITFLNSMETQLNSLANNTNVAPDPVVVNSSDDEEYLSGGEIDGKESDHQRANVDHELKGKLLRKYSGYISTLKNEFSKKKKKGKLPKDAKQILTDWWNVHYKWPYPTEVDKMTLAQVTGLDQKQINNWFINQRKRHWKPSENMQFAVMESLYGPRD